MGSLIALAWLGVNDWTTACLLCVIDLFEELVVIQARYHLHKTDVVHKMKAVVFYRHIYTMYDMVGYP